MKRVTNALRIPVLLLRVMRLESDTRAMERRIRHLEQFQHGHCQDCGAPTDSVTITRCPLPCQGRKAA